MSQKSEYLHYLTKKLWMRVINKIKKKKQKKKQSNTGDKGKGKFKGHTGYY